MVDANEANEASRLLSSQSDSGAAFEPPSHSDSLFSIPSEAQSLIERERGRENGASDEDKLFL